MKGEQKIILEFQIKFQHCWMTGMKQMARMREFLVDRSVQNEENYHTATVRVSNSV